MILSFRASVYSIKRLLLDVLPYLYSITFASSLASSEH